MKLRVLILCLLIAACSRTPEPNGEVRIGVIAPLSGELYESVGRPAREAAELAVQQVNARGGLEAGGRRYRLTVYFEDDEDRPTKAVEAARKLIDEHGVAVLVGPFLSHNALAVAPVAERQRTPMISPSASHPDLTIGRRYVFRVTLADTVRGQSLARFAYRELQAREAAVLYDVDSAYNRSFAEIFRRAFERNGGRVTAFEGYASGEEDFRGPLGRIRDAAPDVLLLPNYAVDVPRQVRQVRKAGIEATLLGADTWDSKGYAPMAGFEDSYYVSEWHADALGKEALRFVRAYDDRYGRRPSELAAFTYDAFGLVAQAIAKEASVERPRIRWGLSTIEGYGGVCSAISFNARSEPTKDLLVIHIQDGEARLHGRIASN